MSCASGVSACFWFNTWSDVNILHCLASNTIKFRKYVPGLIFFQRTFLGFIFGRAYIQRGLLLEGNLCLGIDWAYNWGKICFSNF